VGRNATSAPWCGHAPLAGHLPAAPRAAQCACPLRVRWVQRRTRRRLSDSALASAARVQAWFEGRGPFHLPCEPSSSSLSFAPWGHAPVRHHGERVTFGRRRGLRHTSNQSRHHTPHSPAGGTAAHSVLTSHNKPVPTIPYSPPWGHAPVRHHGERVTIGRRRGLRRTSVRRRHHHGRPPQDVRVQSRCHGQRALHDVAQRDGLGRGALQQRQHHLVCCGTSVTLCAVIPPPGLYMGGGHRLLWDVSALCAVVPPPGLYGVMGTGLLWDISTLCAVVPPPGLYGVWCLLWFVEL
jgi:hypothetical protein